MSSPLPLPYSQPLQNFQRVTISGVVNAVPVGGKTFSVNLKGQSGEFLLHFNARFDEGCVVRNNTTNGQQWQSEERDGGMPFKSGRNFVLELINQNNEKIECIVDGNLFCEFAARDNLNEVMLLEVSGDLQLDSVTDGSERGREARDVPVPDEPEPEIPPIVQPAPPVQPVQPTHPEPTQPEPQPYQPQPAQPQPTGQQGDLSVPYHGPMQDFVRTNRMRIVGTPVPGQTHRFTVNIKAANGDTIFHFNPRFDQNGVVRNFSQNQQYAYETEERGGGPCPFQMGKTFALDYIVANGNLIRCFVDGVEFCQFNVHHDLNQVSTLDVSGDVQLSQILIV